ncbi:MAG: ABC transporter permease [Salinivirgaceae bacterium]|jgi:lipoprotein-releasing system permease protein|nr:ABC transporter permease [Salinivirgaceae bacterium]
MKFAFYIANRYGKKSIEGNRLLSKPMIRIATFGVTLGVAVMIAAVAIVTGFQNEMREKVTGFSAHIQLVNRDLNRSYEYAPVTDEWSYLNEIAQYDHVKSIHSFVSKPGVIKINNEIEAVVLKGIDSAYDWSFFEKYIVDGTHFSLNGENPANGIVLSQYIAGRLQLKVGDRVHMFFMQNPIRMRRFVLTGIYETNLKTYDELYGIVDLRHLQKLNGWDSNQYSGFEILVDDFDELRAVHMRISDRVSLEFNENDESLQTISTLEIAPQIYDWLQLMNMNVWVILILLTLVAGINMITGLLINILEKTNQIGLFKAMGATNKQVIQIFLITAARIIGKGMLYGNIVGLGLCFIQLQFGIIGLDPDNYYLTEVPVNFNWGYILLLNVASFTVNILMMLLPGLLITRIRPTQSIRFD